MFLSLLFHVFFLFNHLVIAADDHSIEIKECIDATCKSQPIKSETFYRNQLDHQGYLDFQLYRAKVAAQVEKSLSETEQMLNSQLGNSMYWKLNKYSESVYKIKYTTDIFGKREVDREATLKNLMEYPPELRDWIVNYAQRVMEIKGGEINENQGKDIFQKLAKTADAKTVQNFLQQKLKDAELLLNDSKFSTSTVVEPKFLSHLLTIMDKIKKSEYVEADLNEFIASIDFLSLQNKLLQDSELKQLRNEKFTNEQSLFENEKIQNKIYFQQLKKDTQGVKNMVTICAAKLALANQYFPTAKERDNFIAKSSSIKEKIVRSISTNYSTSKANEIKTKLNDVKIIYPSTNEEVERKILETINIHIKITQTSSSQKVSQIIHLCDNIALVPDLEDFTVTKAEGIQLSPWTIKYPELGRRVLAHELGHNIQPLLNKNSNSYQMQANVEKCLMKRHKVSTTQYLIEDYADSVAFTTGDKSIAFCFMALPTDSVEHIGKGGTHSTPFLDCYMNNWR